MDHVNDETDAFVREILEESDEEKEETPDGFIRTKSITNIKDMYNHMALGYSTSINVLDSAIEKAPPFKQKQLKSSLKCLSEALENGNIQPDEKPSTGKTTKPRIRTPVKESIEQAINSAIKKSQVLSDQEHEDMEDGTDETLQTWEGKFCRYDIDFDFLKPIPEDAPIDTIVDMAAKMSNVTKGIQINSNFAHFETARRWKAVSFFITFIFHHVCFDYCFDYRTNNIVHHQVHRKLSATDFKNAVSKSTRMSLVSIYRLMAYYDIVVALPFLIQETGLWNDGDSGRDKVRALQRVPKILFTNGQSFKCMSMWIPRESDLLYLVGKPKRIPREKRR